jgi:hypothetical protein
MRRREFITLLGGVAALMQPPNSALSLAGQKRKGAPPSGPKQQPQTQLRYGCYNAPPQLEVQGNDRTPRSSRSWWLPLELLEEALIMRAHSDASTFCAGPTRPQLACLAL